ncbi:MAG TPA: MauE/DoxX family redox-associated membrane protein [Miltoncostaea sp.]|nr:MauE/DoxX family redox-associated membrane protein [Miltoncostaea sp.]
MDLALRIVLALVLLGAATAKLRDRRALVAAVGDHGVPPALRPAAATLLVAVEAALAVLLLIPGTARAAGVGVAVLGLVFAGSLGLMWLRGRRRVPCGCFGGTRERPVAWLIARALLLTAAGVVVAGGWLDRDADAVALLTLGVALLAVAVVVLTVLVLALFRQVGVLEARLGPRAALELEDEGPPLGRPAPHAAPLARRGPELLAFSSRGCRLCAELAPALDALRRDGLPVHELIEDEDPDAFAAHRVPGTPFVVFTVDGVVAGKGLVNTLEQIEELIAVGRERVAAAA